MISKILRQFDQKVHEKELKENEKKVWFKKINDDNVRPLYKPFNFYESKEIDVYFRERERLRKENEEYTKQLDSVRNTKITFGKKYRKHTVEVTLDNSLFCYEMIYSKPTDLQNCYLRDKGINDKDFNFEMKQNLVDDEGWMNTFYFQKFENEFIFGDILRYSSKEEDSYIISKLKNFTLEIKSENIIKFLKDFSGKKYSDDDEILSEKLVEDWKKNYFKIEKLKDLTKEVKNIRFQSNEEYLLSLLDEEKIENIREKERQSLKHTDKLNTDRSRKKFDPDECKKETKDIISKNLILDDFVTLKPEEFEIKFKECIRSKFYKNFNSIKMSLNQVASNEEEPRCHSTFCDLVLAILNCYTLDFDPITKEITISQYDENSIKTFKLLRKYFKVSTKYRFKLFSMKKIIPEESKVNPDLMNCIYLIDREFYKIILNNMQTDNEIKNIFLSSKIDEMEFLLKERLKKDFHNLSLNHEYENELDKITFLDDMKHIITIFSLEGELCKLVCNYFNLDEDFKKYLLLYIILLYYAMFKNEKSSYDCYLYRVLTLNKEEYKNFRKLKKGNMLYNNQFLLLSSNVNEAMKYIVNEKEVSLGLMIEEMRTYSEYVPTTENVENKNTIVAEEHQNKVEEYKIIFVIEVRKEKSYLSPVICDLKEYSSFPFEEEYLMTPNNVFKITDVQRLDNSGMIIIVKLQLISEYYKDNFNTGIFKAKRKKSSLCKNIIFDSNKYHEETVESNSNVKKNTTEVILNSMENPEDIIFADLDLYKSDKMDLSKVINLLDEQVNLSEVSINSINSLLNIESDENTNLKNIEAFLEKAKNIIKLDLSCNNLTHENLHTIVDSFSNLKKLKTLILKKNSLKQLTNFTQKLEEFDLQLLDIDLSFNRLDIVGVRDLTSLMQKTCLHKINLSYNKINAEGAKLFAEKLKDTPNLQYLDLSNNNLFSSDYNFEKMLSKNFVNVKKLNTLLLQGCNLTSQSIKYLSENIKECVGLEVINLSCNRIDQYDYEGSTSFSTSLQYLKKLRYLNLGYNYIGHLGIGGLKALLFSFEHLYNLQRFMINGNSFDSSYILLNRLKFVENLIELNMNELKIGDEGLKELSNSFIYLKNLEYLHLNNNRISAAGIQNMKQFSKLENLKELNLSNNSLKAEGCLYLKFNKNLEVLNLWANDIRVLGVKNLLSNIKSHFNLREISFSQNNIDDKEKNGKADGMIFILKTITNDLLNIKNINFSSNHLNQSSFYHLIYYYPIIKSRRIYLNICDCPSHSDLNNGVKGEFEKLSKDDGLVKFSI